MSGRNVEIILRSREATLLERLADRDDLTESEVLDRIVQNVANDAASITGKPALMVRKHLSPAPPTCEVIDRLMVIWGVSRSEVVRRLMADELNRAVVL